MVRRAGRTALLVAALAAVAFAFSALQAMGTHAQTAPICLTVPASNTVTCFDEFGNPVAQFTNPAASVTSFTGATPPTVVLPPTLVPSAPTTLACYTDQFGNLVCPPAVSGVPLTQPVVLSPQQPLFLQLQSAVLQPQLTPAQAQPLAPTGPTCFMNPDGSVSCM